LKYSAAVGTADKVTTDGDVEENKELALELERAIHSARDITPRRIGAYSGEYVSINRFSVLVDPRLPKTRKAGLLAI